jgi:hypothetical protein
VSASGKGPRGKGMQGHRDTVTHQVVLEGQSCVNGSQGFTGINRTAHAKNNKDHGRRLIIHRRERVGGRPAKAAAALRGKRPGRDEQGFGSEVDDLFGSLSFSFLGHEDGNGYHFHSITRIVAYLINKNHVNKL